MAVETFGELEHDLERALDGLTPTELAWRPGDGANTIGFTFWHLTRAEDSWISGFVLGRPHMFERDGWATGWNIPPKDTGSNYTGEQLAAFPTPPIEELWQYHRAVTGQTHDYLERLSQDELKRKPPPDNPLHRRDYTVGQVLTHLFCEIGQHVGHIRYIRGLQRGINA